MRFAHGLNSIKWAVLHKTSPFSRQSSPSCPLAAAQTRGYRTRKSPVPPANASPLRDEAALVVDGLEQQSPVIASAAPDPPPTPKRGRKPRVTKDHVEKTASDLVFTHPRAISQNHDDLPSFLAYAHSSALSPTSNVYVGTHYEYLVSTSVTPLGFTLTRVGGVSDLGIDLLGQWSLPSLPHTLPAIIQCKATAPQPVFIRELEGAMQSAPAAWKGDNAIALLAATKLATKGVRDAIARTSFPMAFLCITAEEGLVRQFIWNHAAVSKCGLEGVGVALKYPDESVVLTWQGEPWHDLSKQKNNSA